MQKDASLRKFVGIFAIATLIVTILNITCIVGTGTGTTPSIYMQNGVINATSLNINGNLTINGLNRTDAVANPIGPYSYIIDLLGCTYRMKNCTTGQIDVQDGNYTLVEQYAINNLTSGTVYLKEVLFNTSLTIPSNVVVIQSYRGIETRFPYRFSIMQVTDTQYLARNYTSLYNDVCNWIVTNAVSYNLKMVIHTGDLVDTASNTTQWDIANNSMSLLLNNSIPYCWDAGNHDQTGGDPNADWLGANYLAFNATYMQTKPYWVDSIYNSKNTAVKFTASGQNILIINIEYWANSSVLSWMTNLITTNPGYKVIVATHSYLNGRGGYGASGVSETWEDNFEVLLNQYPSVLMVASGHTTTDVVGTAYQSVRTREELFFNRQGIDTNQGAAAVRIYTFDTQTNIVNALTYKIYPTAGFITDSLNQFSFQFGGSNSGLGIQQTTQPFYTVGGLGGTSTFATQNRTYLVPIQIPFKMNVTALGVVWVGTTAGSVCVGLYFASAGAITDQPLIVNVSAVKGATYTAQEIAITPIVLAEGIYWFAVQSSETTSIIQRASPAGMLSSTATYSACYFDSTTFGSLPTLGPAVTKSTAVLAGGYVLGTPIT